MLSYTNTNSMNVEFRTSIIRVTVKSLEFITAGHHLETVADQSALVVGNRIDPKGITDLFAEIAEEVTGIKGGKIEDVPVAVKIAVRDYLWDFAVDWDDDDDEIDLDAPQKIIVTYMGEPITCVLKSLREIEERNYVTRYLNDRIAGHGRKRAHKFSGAIADLFGATVTSVTGLEDWTGKKEDTPYVVKAAVAGALASVTAAAQPLDELSAVGE